ncbi:MAG: hypothetical protein Q8920_09345 [Bacillota bacterium]|nr:hypothetical protein [Bacillota bacterium]
MRVKRLEKYRRSRRKKVKRILFFTILLPITCIVAGYLITSLIILPSMSAK